MQRETLDGDRVFVIHEFLSADECRELIRLSERAGYEAFNVSGEAVTYRTNARLEWDDEELADRLWLQARPYLPPVSERPPCRLNPRFRFYRYTGDEYFAPHYDGSVRLGPQRSELTFMIYLNDVALGGETRFNENGEVRFSVQPTCGMALVFDHQIMHEGVPVREGEKYALRTDVMFAAPSGE